MEDPPPSAASSEPAPVATASAPSEASHSNPSSSPNPAQPPPSTASSPSIAAPSTSQNPPQPQSQSIPPSQSHQPIQQHLRPPVLRNRPQSSFPHFDHQLPSPATPSISSSTSSAGPAVSASPSAPTSSSQRAGLAIGVPAHSPHIRAQESSAASYPTFGASSSFTQPFSALPRMPEQPPTANAQVRQPIQGIQNIGMIGSLSTSSQIRSLGASGPPQQRFIQPTSRGPAFSVNQNFFCDLLLSDTQLLTNLMRRVHSTYAVPMLGLFAKDSPLLHRPLRPASSKANLPTLVQTNPVQSGAISAAIDTDAAESGNQVLSKRSIRELVNQIDPSEKLDSEVEDILVDIGEDFIESITTFACSLAKHRKSSTLEAKDILLHVERNWNITLPGFGGDEVKCYKKQDLVGEQLSPTVGPWLDYCLPFPNHGWITTGPTPPHGQTMTDH
ncbi:hypothetical protein ZIOFF_006016 [Zingiber officinale]|uniref:Transcription initiation factor TFIID subunit 12 domain-containing protein n=1 Tax=Zingiber officinale TaxID=94328 RepID=A0A8J5HRL7_ZINOF|nr:hypothetical protein ZIOFF_006016 [Zingiber officinale]